MTRSPIELLWTAKKKYFLNVKRPTAFCIYRLKCSKATSRCDGLDGSGNLYNLYAPLLRAPLCDANNLYWLQPFIFVLIALQIIRVSRQKREFIDTVLGLLGIWGQDPDTYFDDGHLSMTLFTMSIFLEVITNITNNVLQKYLSQGYVLSSICYRVFVIKIFLSINFATAAAICPWCCGKFLTWFHLKEFPN